MRGTGEMFVELLTILSVNNLVQAIAKDMNEMRGEFIYHLFFKIELFLIQ